MIQRSSSYKAPPRRSGWGLAILFVGAALAPGTLQAQSLTHGDVEVTIVDGSGNRIRDAIATLHLAGEVIVTGRQEVTGSVVFSALAPGTGQLRIEALGFRPVLFPRLVIDSGRSTSLRVQLAEAAEPFDQVDTLAWTPGQARTGPVRYLDQRLLEHLADPERDPTGLGNLASDVTQTLGFEGLPGSLTRVLIDGVPVGRPGRLLGDVVTGHTPRIGLREVALSAVGGDMEIPGVVSGAVLETSGPPATQGVAYGAILPSATIQGVGDPPSLGSGVSIGAAASASGSGALVSAGAEFARVDLPKVGLTGLPSGSIPTGGGTIDLDALGRDAVRPVETIRGFGRLDWAQDDVRVRFTGGVSQESLGASGTGLIGTSYAERPASDGLAVFANGSFQTLISEDARFEFKIGFDRDERGSDAGADELDFGLPATRFTSTGGRLGLGTAGGGASTSRGLFLSPQVGASSAERSWKGGIQLESRSYSYSNDHLSRPVYVFSGMNEAAAGVGGFVGGGPVESTDFRLTTLGGFFHTDLAVGERGSLSLGGRVDYNRLPLQDYEVAVPLTEQTGLLPTVDNSALGISGSIKASYDLSADGSSQFFGLVGASRGTVDPEAMNEVLGLATGQLVQRATGPLDPWPTPPPSVAGVTTPQFTLLGADYRLPRTVRSQFGVIGRKGPLLLGVSVAARRTDFLLRRRDLNRRILSLGGSTQQDEIFGVLEQFGTSVLTAPGSDRRFPSFDRIWTLDPDGWSEYMGATVTAAYESPSAWANVGYTLSRTQDNWVGARSPIWDARLISRPEDGWDEASSDFDLPHQAVAHGGVRVPGPYDLWFGGSFRFRSAYPFTPGYRDGVDLNGDGSFVNDVPLLDPQLGAGSLGWDCVASASPGVAVRNDCRGPSVQEMDLFIASEIPGVASARVRLDVMNLVASDWGEHDEALYLIDAGGSGPESLMVNPDFGTIRIPLTSPRMIRLGLTLEF